MSVLKNLDIDLPQSEKKTLYRFLSLYVFFTIVILGLTISLYYTLQKELASSQRTIVLDEYANEFLIALEELHNDKTDTLLYPTDAKFKTSLYGKDYKLIYSTLTNPKNLLTEVTYTNNKIIRYVAQPEKYYLNTQYIIVEMMDDKEWLNETIKTIVIYSSIFFIFMLVVGYFLLNLFLKPMKDALHLLDIFIKDTTHELNTPVSTIMTNIELIDKESIQDKYLLKSINRIDIGAKTISNIYDDLTYLVLNNKIVSDNQDINLKQLIEQRVEYFSTLANIKKIKVVTNLDADAVLNIDNKKLSKLVDNILSNAIKYNKINGSINIDLDANKLTIKDTGKGIKEEHIDSMFDRYARFDKIVGGFGIGLNIVKMICNEYDLTINITSKLDNWTEVSISW
ncbi:two-component sensor histidine kinase [Sulfurimonas gotlandica GD1]|uniref:histidine kinase n=1 Tax=Sulfurimonas gotlandica (strain DSM 19862 / JCM 16533 / GD1) TaxID=929558 RepID=B6BHK8_SULGG|nr:HAMP domain-containing sensor histidine kinase [Sulfurimonas gotlandica]EDZ63255.1 histidine kinase [Sulfurimonas gotlandica GD1]EHP30006.1 two-component sensor histidine kinase [Sulfurimonas gotlandica GD1]